MSGAVILIAITVEMTDECQEILSKSGFGFFYGFVGR